MYPDTIIITVKPSATKNSDGDWMAVTGLDTVHTLECRGERSSYGGKITGRDGIEYDYSYIVYLPRMSYIIPENAECQLIKDGQTISGKVKASGNGMFNSRIWL